MIVEIWDWERFNFDQAMEKAKVRLQWQPSASDLCSIVFSQCEKTEEC
jgi:hypothetical protein